MIEIDEFLFYKIYKKMNLSSIDILTVQNKSHKVFAGNLYHKDIQNKTYDATFYRQI